MLASLRKEAWLQKTKQARLRQVNFIKKRTEVKDDK